MASMIVDSTQMDTSLFSYSAPKAHSSGGKVVNLYNKNSRESLTLSTPLMMTWGAQESKDQAGNPLGKYTMSLQFPSAEYPNEDAEACLKGMRTLEDKVKNDAMLYSKEWFGKNISSREVMDEKFNVMLRQPKLKGTQEPDDSKAPTMSLKIPCWSGTWKTQVYDEDSEPLFIHGKENAHLSPLDFLKSKTYVMCLIQCGGLWFVNGKVSITWNLMQVMVKKPRESLEGTCFLKPKESDVKKLKEMADTDEVEAPSTSDFVSATVEDSDDEAEEVEAEEAEDEEEPEPEPEPEPIVIKKKRVVKKKAP